MAPLRLESVRARLTVFYVSVLAAALIIVGGLIYALLARALYTRIDDGLHALVQITSNSLGNDLAEGQDYADAARSTAAELASRQQMLVIYDDAGRLLAEAGRDDDLRIVLPPLESIPDDEPRLTTAAEVGDPDDRHRLATRRLTIQPNAATYIVVAGSSIEPIDEELEALREILLYVVPLALACAGLGGWFLARRSLSPVAAMADRARRIGAEDLSARLPVSNPADELGRLAETFNELLGRLEASLTLQREFMADASHELRTPVTTARTAASVALQQPHRDEREYREALEIVEQQTVRLSRIVEDMFTLARADAGNYPVRRGAMYLDEIVDEAVRGARVLAAPKRVDVEVRSIASASLVGDEDLMRRLIGNLLDNAIRHAPAGTIVRVDFDRSSGGYAIAISDAGPGIPPDSQQHIFDRFYRADRSRARGPADGGAGLGLALARWIARVHGGDVTLTRSSGAGSTFTIVLPDATAHG
jgi:two-component system, OmpR family, sensor kinase